MKVTPRQITQACSKLIGVPYRILDCWGIVRQFYYECHGIELKRYYELPPNDIHKANKLIIANRGDFRKVTRDEILPGDIITIYLMGIESHIAVYLGEGKILHTHRNSGCMVDRLNKWEKSVSGIYRIEVTSDD